MLVGWFVHTAVIGTVQRSPYGPLRHNGRGEMRGLQKRFARIPAFFLELLETSRFVCV